MDLLKAYLPDLISSDYLVKGEYKDERIEWLKEARKIDVDCNPKFCSACALRFRCQKNVKNLKLVYRGRRKASSKKTGYRKGAKTILEKVIFGLAKLPKSLYKSRIKPVYP